MMHSYTEGPTDDRTEPLPARLRKQLSRSRHWCLILASLFGVIFVANAAIAVVPLLLRGGRPLPMEVVGISGGAAILAIVLGLPALPLFFYSRRIKRTIDDGDLLGLIQANSVVRWLWMCFFLILVLMILAEAGLVVMIALEVL